MSAGVAALAQIYGTGPFGGNWERLRLMQQRGRSMRDTVRVDWMGVVAVLMTAVAFAIVMIAVVVAVIGGGL